MALPTLRPFFATRGSLLHERHIQKRTNEDANRRRWAENSRYFTMSDIRASKEQTWSSSQAFSDSLATYNNREKVAEKQKRLKERKEKLASLLTGEREQYEIELKNCSPDQLLIMRNRVERLKTQRINKDKKISEEKMQVHRRANCPELRRLESRQMQRVVQEEQKEQVERRKKELEAEREKKKKFALAVEEERLAALKLQDDDMASKKMMEQEYVKDLQQQMAEIRAREEEARRLEHQQELFVREKIELERCEEERRHLLQAQMRADFGRVLLRQHKAKMKRKSKQIQEALELDMRILENLAQKRLEEVSIQSARRETAKSDVQWMKQVIAEQIQLEKMREQELDLLYQEEAARMWRKREDEWAREEQARERLMNEVLTKRQKQIVGKIDAVREEQAESIQRREELLQAMEETRQMTARDASIRAKEKEHRIEELSQQISERKKQRHRDLEINSLELVRQREIEEDHGKYISAEERRLETQRFSPKFHGRRKVAWY